MRLLPLHRGRPPEHAVTSVPGARAGEDPLVARRRRHRRIISALRTDTVVSTLAGRALRVTTARARSHDLGTGPFSARDVGTRGSARPLRFRGRSTVRRRWRIRPSPSTAEGPPRPAPGGGHAPREAMNHERRPYILQPSEGARSHLVPLNVSVT